MNPQPRAARPFPLLAALVAAFLFGCSTLQEHKAVTLLGIDQVTLRVLNGKINETDKVFVVGVLTAIEQSALYYLDNTLTT